MGDIDTFDSLLLKPLQDDVVQYTWLYERYDNAGNQIRTPYYFEYPSLVTMLLTEVRYGIGMGVASIAVNPFRSPEVANEPFTFAFGAVLVRYDPSAAQVATLCFPGYGVEKSLSVYGLAADTAYHVQGIGKCGSQPKIGVKSDAKGVLQFSWQVFSECTLQIFV